MTREEYDLIYSAFRSYRVYMTDAEEVLSEKILDDLFYPEFDKLKNVSEPQLPELSKGQELEDMVDSDYDETGERIDDGIKSLNFR